MRLRLAIVLVGMCVLPTVAAAQDRPFVFLLTTTPDRSTRQVRVDYDVGVGDQAFHQQKTNGPEQRFGIQASAARFTFVGHVGVMAAGATYETSQQVEMLASILRSGTSGPALAVGGGLLHEAGGVNVLLGRVVAGHEGVVMRLHASLLFQKPLSNARDAVDLTTSIGWAARITRAWVLGVEAVGEDLEGFWEAQEAEGGSRILVGPSIHLAPPKKSWQLSVAGGPTFHPNTSGRSSEALRDLPATTAARDYAVRTTFSLRF